MTKPTIYFAHANSFPAGTYRQYFSFLEEKYKVDALEMFGHDPRFAVDDGWNGLLAQLEHALQSRSRKPVILVGHSLGGMLSLMLGRARPDLARCVVLLDAPVVAGWRARAWWLLKTLKQSDRVSPAKFSRQRRNHWPDADAAYAHFAAKPMFACWPEQVLRDYIASATRPGEQGLELAFTREVETEIYRAVPHHLSLLLKDPYPLPVGFIGGEDSNECRQAGMYATRKLVGRHLQILPGGHLFPMENPLAAAIATDVMIQRLLAGAAQHS